MASKNVQSFTEANFESDVLKSDVPVLVTGITGREVSLR